MKKLRIKNGLWRILNQSQLKMKLTLLFLFLSLFQISASNTYGQNNRVSIYVSEVPLIQVFQMIEHQTDYRFFYNSKDLDVRKKLVFNIEDKQLTEVLEQLFRNSDISYQIFGNQIVLKKEVAPTRDVTVNLAQQQTPLTGNVSDKFGTPLAGVTVLVEGTNHGVVTNFDGEFKISLKESEKVLVFSYLGYRPYRIVVGEQTNLNIIMEEDFSQLEEVVLIGYGQQKREAVSGAVSSIKTKDIVQASVGSIGFDRSLGGLVKGVQVSQNTGRPGAPVRLNIRGVTSPLSSGGLNQPLFVIDGVPFNLDALKGANPLLTINPADIESFDVLKDAAATSIYGSRGANGVILIKTKRGKKGQAPSVNMSYTTTIAKPINTVNVLDANQYRNYYDMMIGNSVNAMNAGQLDPFFSFDLANIGKVALDWSTFMVNYDGLRDDYFGDANTNWNKEVFRSAAVTKQANISLNGGSEKTNYAFSLSYTDQEGLTLKDGLEQYTMAMSLDTDVSDFIKVGGSINLGHTEATSGEDDLFGQYTINTSIARARPDLPVRDENGKLLGQSDYTYGAFETIEPNPLMRLQNKTNNKTYNFIGNSYVEVKPVKDLTLKADVNAAVFYTDNSSFVPKVTQTDFQFFPNDSFLSETNGLVSNVTTNLTAKYDLSVANHDFNLLVGAAWDRTNYNNKSHFYAGFPDDDILINASSAETVLSYTGNRLETGLNSLFSRLTYGYKNRYNATVNFRTDTSSKFGPGNKRAYFPSLSASWNIANENFLTDVEKVNTLKFRASIGRVGSTNVSDFAYLQFFQTNSSDVYNGSSAVIPNNNFPNTEIGWETTEEINVGLDFAFFNSRLRGGVDVYNRKTTDALVSTPLPLELGPNSYFANFIDVSNRGVEVSLGGDIVRGNDFTWSTNVNWSVNRNKLDKLKGANINPFQLDYYVEGEPVGTIKGYKVVKIFQTQDKVDALNANAPDGFYDQFSTSVGDFMYEDVNGDGEITADDRTIIGDIQPDFFGGISNTFTYKNLSLKALMQYSVGAETIWNSIPMSTFNTLGENKYSEYALNTWTPENTDARYARALYFDPSQSGRISDRYLFDTSYLRLKSVQLTYDFDKNLMDKFGLDGARITLSGTNLVTWTKWPGIDPETFSERGGIIDQVSNEDPYPLAKAFSLGVQIQF
ncbi:TonB-linked outer membrane protein, SusC/RagA family [Arenibacter nanhaiticus]|uniref:TonB-linked outer membrane protein, SusC/RagA family n=1 Tax=Arenibacter nanhaiticus TaxID=558155 RepID=A0A1M6M7W1_9FLAO|nr:TonB-dependent receptor [Arenibacter nanhaiticus]SHJ79548.1 TonB-linked outer membrane protein, SusC/RagA family [Arenibacter nanhaiticus]